MNAQLLRIGDDIVAMHAVVTDEGVTLIDAGLPGDRRILRQALAAAGRTVADIRGVVLTHGDSDHIGVAEWLRTEHGVPTIVHEADAGRARGDKTPSASGGAWKLGPALRFLGVAVRRGAMRTKHLGEVRTVRGGEVLDLPGAPEIIGLPGHSPGSIAIRIPAVDALFLGDAITTRHVLNGSEDVQVGPFSDAPAQTPESLEKLRNLPETTIVVGHGPIFHGTAAEMLAALKR
jgi:glyoxylase-like metal-dependent hydrolase (beta-lactamase superfamily II)